MGVLWEWVELLDWNFLLAGFKLFLLLRVDNCVSETETDSYIQDLEFFKRWN
jgi:hypothetical protein